MIDIHSHILAGLDDGARSLEESVAMVRMAVKDNIPLEFELRRARDLLDTSRYAITMLRSHRREFEEPSDRACLAEGPICRPCTLLWSCHIRNAYECLTAYMPIQSGKRSRSRREFRCTFRLPHEGSCSRLERLSSQTSV